MKKLFLFMVFMPFSAWGLTITGATNCFYSNAANTTIDCTFQTTESGTIPYTASANDPMPYGQALWESLQAGTYGGIAAYTAPTLTAAQKADKALAAGAVVTSTATSALNGTYAIDAESLANINATVTYILVNGNFPGGVSSFPWYDATGAAHTFSSTTQFNSFASAIANYVAMIALYKNSNGQAGSLPSNAISIP